jgi:CRISPR system Cascade subunit CasD
VSALVLRLAGPLQSWGSRSRFVRRETEPAPTKSGVIGLLAAARGVRRTDELTEFFGLRFGVRVDQPGRLVRDFQTARSLDGRQAMPLSYRYYLADAVFLAVVEGDHGLLEGLEQALWHPAFPLYLGRRSCPPAGPISCGLRDGGVDDALQAEGWQAAPWHQRSVRAPSVRLATVRDAHAEETDAETLRDEPVSFNPTRREYTWRSVVHGHVEVPNPHAPAGPDSGDAPADHDPMALLGG